MQPRRGMRGMRVMRVIRVMRKEPKKNISDKWRRDFRKWVVMRVQRRRKRVRLKMKITRPIV
jgi:hypothetical protein